MGSCEVSLFVRACREKWKLPGLVRSKKIVHLFKNLWNCECEDGKLGMDIEAAAVEDGFSRYGSKTAHSSRPELEFAIIYACTITDPLGSIP